MVLSKGNPQRNIDKTLGLTSTINFILNARSSLSIIHLDYDL